MWTRALLASKLRAAGIHLGLSAIAFAVVLYFILASWYPEPWFIDGGWQGVRLMVLVDLVLGPVLTFIIFTAAKSRRALWFDFTMIGVAQLAAFAWGVYAVHGQRPVGIVFLGSAFYSFEERPLRWQGHSAADLVQFDPREPAVLYAEEPKAPEQQRLMLEKIRRYELGTYEVFELLRALKPNIDRIWERSDSLAQMLWADPQQAAKLERILAKHPGLKREDLRFAWFIGRYQDATLVMTQEGDVLGTVGYVQPKKLAKPGANRARAPSAT